MGSAETERLLAEKLRLKFSERGVEKRYELEEFAIFLKARSAKNVLSSLAQDLSALATRANPVYAPVIAEYAEIAARLLRGKTTGSARRLERLRKAREAVTAQMRQIDDYLNWFEATGLGRPSGEFADYMRAAERATPAAEAFDEQRELEQVRARAGDLRQRGERRLASLHVADAGRECERVQGRVVLRRATRGRHAHDLGDRTHAVLADALLDRLGVLARQRPL